MRLEEQLRALADAGLVLNGGVTADDLTLFEPRAALEAQPFKGVIEAMGHDLEHAPFTPMCNRLWMCDYECIEDAGSYRQILLRLELMTGGGMAMERITDHIDHDAGEAWVQFSSRGTRYQWDAKFDGDWLDPYMLAAYAVRLRESGSKLEIYSNHTDYGQVALLGAFTREEKRRFDALSKVELILMEEQV